MIKSIFLREIHISASDLEGITRLRNIAAKLATMALVAQRKGVSEMSAAEFTLADLLELAYAFEYSSEKAFDFWREIEFMEKLQNPS